MEKSIPAGQRRQSRKQKALIAGSNQKLLLSFSGSRIRAALAASDRSVHLPLSRQEQKFPADLPHCFFPEALIKAKELKSHSTSMPAFHES